MRNAKAIFLITITAAVFFLTTLTAQYRFDSWTTESGLPQNSVNSLAQTRDGYIWFATFGGLVRFDGIKFKIFNTINAPTFTTNRIISLTEAGDGTLWIGAQNGDLISYKNEVFTRVIENPAAQRTPLEVVFADRNGDLWLKGPTGLERHTLAPSGKWLTQNVEIPNEANPLIGTIRGDDGSNIWVSTSVGLYQFQNGGVRSFLYSDSLPTERDPNGQIVPRKVKLLLDREKRLWLYSDNFVARFENDRFSTLINKAGANFNLAENPDHTFCLLMDGKVYRFAADKAGEPWFDTADISAEIRSMMSDREGNVWIGTNGRGLRRYKRQTARTFAQADGLTDKSVYFVFEDRDKTMWIGSDNLYRYRGGKFETVTTGGRFTSAFQSKDGRLWFGRDNQLLTYQSGKFEMFGKDLRMPNPMVIEDRQERLWIPVEDGLLMISGGTRQHYSAENGFIGSSMQSMFEDRDGAIWFAMTGGASRFKDGVFTNFTSKDGLSNDNVRDIYQDRDGVIWLGTYGGGLNRLKDGKFFAATTREGMNEDIVSRIIVDEKDTFWLLGNRGVSVISRSALNDLADGKIKSIACGSYGVSDGMANSEGNGGNYPAGWRASDGRMWFPSIQGVIVVDAAATDPPPPPVYIEDVFLSGKQVEGSRAIEIAPDAENLEIHYTGLNFSKPEQVKFRYKLEGFDHDWIEVGNRRVAYYTRIPPGNYRFLVMASTTNGVWSQSAEREVIALSNPIWKKWWFILSVSLFAIVALVVFYRLRLRQLEKIRRQQQEFSRQLIDSQEQERKRIAGELHDGLGQTLLIIKNRAFLGTKAQDLEVANDQFNEISVSSGEALNQAREIAYHLRPSQLERFGLTSALEEMVRQAGESSEIDFVSRIDPLDGVFSPENEINFYRIVQELVNNILKHSAATKAEVRIGRAVNKIELLIEDNGQGLAREQPHRQTRSGFGLFGIEERLRILGGKFSLVSEPGQGAKVSITIETAK